MTSRETPLPLAKSPPYAEPARRLVLLHNTQVLLVFVAGLICAGITKQRGGGMLDMQENRWLDVLRVVAPIAVLLLTGVYTQFAMTAFAKRSVAGPLAPVAVLPLFARCKRISMYLLTAAALFACVCLILGNRVMDVALALLAWGLLVATRPSVKGFESFAAIVEAQREELAKDDFDA